MVTPTAGSVVLVPFPFSDLPNSKLRPAAALADAGKGDRVMCQVTGNSHSDPRAVELDGGSLQSGPLHLVSYARPGKFLRPTEA